MINRIISLSALFFATTIFMVSCKKDNNSSNADYTTETATHSDDQSRFSGELDAVANDADATLETTAGFTGRLDNLICDATVVVDTIANPRTITITYNGSNCLGTHTRTGVVVISMVQGVRWKNAGAVLNVNIQNLKITRTSDNKSITINGTHTYTNVSGGLLLNLPVLGTITHTITSNGMSVTFDNGTQRTWQVARQRTFTFNNGVVITTTGTHTEGAVTGITEWGTNRFGHAFTTAIVQPIVNRQDCSFRIGAGKLSHATSLYTANATFGLDAAGNATSCPGLGNYYMKLEWTRPAGNTHTSLIPY
jgi:hypothetical protein